LKYKYDYSKLRGRIREKIGTEGEFAKLIGRSVGYISQVFNGSKQLSQDDICNAIEVLGIDPCDIGAYFFRVSVHKTETDEVKA